MKTLTTEKKSTLLTDETFNKLRLAQRQIQDKTDFSPSFRYLINHVINDNSIEQSINRLISVQSSKHSKCRRRKKKKKMISMMKMKTLMILTRLVEEKFERIFRVNREMRDEILVYESILSKFWAKMVSKCRENAAKIWILGFRC